MTKKTDRELIEEKNYAELYNRYTAKIHKFANQVQEYQREDFLQDAYFSVVDAVDGADLSREFNSFGTILHYRLLGLRGASLKSHNDDKSRTLYMDPFSPTGNDMDTTTTDSMFETLAQDENSCVYTFSPEHFITEDREKEVIKRYNMLMESLPELHRNYLKCKMEEVPRSEMTEILGVGVHRLSHISHAVKAVACEIFDMDYKKHRDSKLARRLMKDAECEKQGINYCSA